MEIGVARSRRGRQVKIVLSRRHQWRIAASALPKISHPEDCRAKVHVAATGWVLVDPADARSCAATWESRGIIWIHCRALASDRPFGRLHLRITSREFPLGALKSDVQGSWLVDRHLGYGNDDEASLRRRIFRGSVSQVVDIDAISHACHWSPLQQRRKFCWCVVLAPKHINAYGHKTG